VTEPVRPDDLGRVRAFLGAPLAVVLLLATIGSFAVGSG
jgi:hypothetical protein